MTMLLPSFNGNETRIKTEIQTSLDCRLTGVKRLAVLNYGNNIIYGSFPNFFTPFSRNVIYAENVKQKFPAKIQREN